MKHDKIQVPSAYIDPDCKGFKEKKSWTKPVLVKVPPGTAHFLRLEQAMQRLCDVAEETQG